MVDVIGLAILLEALKHTLYICGYIYLYIGLYAGVYVPLPTSLRGAVHVKIEIRFIYVIFKKAA